MENHNLLIQLLYQMAYADGTFQEEEKAFISEVMERHQISPDDLMSEKVEIPQDERSRMSILYYLLFLIKIDGKIEESERNFAHKFGLLLGFREEMITAMLTLMEKHLDTKLPQDDLVKIIRQYLN